MRRSGHGEQPHDGAAARLEAARRTVDDYDKRLAKYRAALEAGAEPLIVAGWMREVQGERLTAERELADVPAAEPLFKTQIRSLVAGVRNALQLLAGADPAIKATVYAGLGIDLT